MAPPLSPHRSALAVALLGTLSFEGHAQDLFLSSKRQEESGCDPASVNMAGPPGAAYPSPGCSKADFAAPPPWCSKDVTDGERTIEVDEQFLGGKSKRKYVIKFPRSSTCNGGIHGFATRPAPLMLFFHGQFGDAVTESKGPWISQTKPSTCGADNGFISVFPQGLNDHNKQLGESGGLPTFNGGGPDLGTGWNVGAAGDERTCWKESDGDLLPPTQYSCYESCQKLKWCGRCNWSTCHDDVAFAKALLTQLTQEFCVDMTRIYLAGQSNGGMLTHYLYQRLPHAFAVAAPIYALPLLGHLFGGEDELLLRAGELKETAFLAFYDRQDRVIPLRGGMAPSQGWTWYYEPLTAVLTMWATVHGCNVTGGQIESHVPFEHKNTFDCQEYPRCLSGRRVVWCEYNGHHGEAPPDHGGPYGLFWFFNQFRRTSPSQWD